MDPVRHQGRRQARANYYNQMTEGTYYTDASYHQGTAYTTVVSNTTSTTNKHTGVPTATDGEEQAILEAITQPAHHMTNITIRTDSQEALRDFELNTLPPHITTHLQAYLLNHPDLHIRLEWIPGHQGIAGNEAAHSATREHDDPGPGNPWPSTPTAQAQARLQRRERKLKLQQRRQQRRTLPLPTPLTSRHDTALLRQAQTNSLPCDLYNHYITQQPNTPHCQVCGAYPNPEHTYWTCPRAKRIFATLTFPADTPPPTSWSLWVTPPPTLRSLYWPQLLNHIRMIQDRQAPPHT